MRCGIALGAGAVLLLAAMTPAAAQDLRLEIDSLRTPASPAFVLLGIAPVAIERPSSLRAIALSAVSSLRQSGGIIPNDYAIEIAPYWLRSRAAVTFDAFRTAGPLTTAARTLGVSLATMKYEVEGDADEILSRGTRIGAGFRFLLFDGTPSPRLDALTDSLRALHSQCILLPEPDDELCIEALGTRDVALEIQREARDPDGFVLEVASALTGDFPNDVFEIGRIDRFGVWVTPGLRLRDSEFEFFGVARYIRERRGGTADLIDAGGRIGWTGSRFALAAEGVQRHVSLDSDSETRYRVTGSFEARLSESLLASFTFGKGYEPAAGDPEGRDQIIATLALSFGAGARPTLAIPLAGGR